jgi:glutamine phosphoribosylpyrophosphate amidotransferase
VRESSAIVSHLPRESCGVFGVFSPGEEVARMAYFGLIQLQHRGEESAGIAARAGGLVRAVGLPRESLCMACLEGEYPIEVSDELLAQKTALEELE